MLRNRLTNDASWYRKISTLANTSPQTELSYDLFQLVGRGNLPRVSGHQVTHGVRCRPCLTQRVVISSQLQPHTVINWTHEQAARTHHPLCFHSTACAWRPGQEWTRIIEQACIKCAFVHILNGGARYTSEAKWNDGSSFAIPPPQFGQEQCLS